MSFQTWSWWINIAVACGIGIAALRRRGTPGALSLAVLSFFVALWSFSYVFFDNATVPIDHQWSAAVIYLSSAIVAAAQFTFALSHTNRQPWIRRPTFALLGVMPVITQVLLWIKPAQSLLFGDLGSQTAGLLFFSGPWAKVNAFYIYSLTGASVLLLLDFHLRDPIRYSAGAGYCSSGLFFRRSCRRLPLHTLAVFPKLTCCPSHLPLLHWRLSSVCSDQDCWNPRQLTGMRWWKAWTMAGWY